MNAGLATVAAFLLTAGSGAEPALAPLPAVDEELAEVVVIGRQRLYVAPTTRDGIGRVWVPVHLNGKGPFRMVLDTGAQRSAVTANVAQALGIPTDLSPPVMMRGATGSAVAPTIQVDTLSVGELWVEPDPLPIVADAFGGAQGLLGMDGMQDKRIYIDFNNDFINISRSRNRRADVGFVTLDFLPNRLNLLVVHAQIGRLKVEAIIDTGAQATIGNNALRTALRGRVERGRYGEEDITGATGDVQTGIGARVSPIAIGGISISDANVTFGDMHIFEMWNLGKEPALVIGMDLIGLLDTLVIDYRRQELHLKPR